MLALEHIRRACQITRWAQQQLGQLIVHGARVNEEDLARLFVHLCAQVPGTGPEAFPAIVAAGENAFTLHHTPTRRLLQPGELVVVDVGTTYQGYCADITRTFRVGGGNDLRERVVRQALQRLMTYMRPGHTWGQLQAYAEETCMPPALEACGLPRDRGLPHACGHYIGRVVHDTGPDRLPAGWPVALELGIYVQGQWGVRVEEVVEVTWRGGIPV